MIDRDILHAMNEKYPFGGFRVRTIKLPAWQIALIGAAAAALVITLAIVATGVFLIVFPAILLVDWAYRWKRRRSSPVARTSSPGVIEADYKVLPPDVDVRDPARHP